MPTEPEPVKMTVTCTKAKCVNRNVLINITTYPHANVICGPCGSTLVADVPEPS
jgi:ribosomal protein S27E